MLLPPTLASFHKAHTSLTFLSCQSIAPSAACTFIYITSNTRHPLPGNAERTRNVTLLQFHPRLFFQFPNANSFTSLLQFSSTLISILRSIRCMELEPAHARFIVYDSQAEFAVTLPACYTVRYRYVTPLKEAKTIGDCLSYTYKLYV